MIVKHNGKSEFWPFMRRYLIAEQWIFRWLKFCGKFIKSSHLINSITFIQLKPWPNHLWGRDNTFEIYSEEIVNTKNIERLCILILFLWSTPVLFIFFSLFPFNQFYSLCVALRSILCSSFLTHVSLYSVIYNLNGLFV